MAIRVQVGSPTCPFSLSPRPPREWVRPGGPRDVRLLQAQKRAGSTRPSSTPPRTSADDSVLGASQTGRAAERFAGEFTDSYGLDGVSEDVLHEVTRRTPGFHAWQDPRWLVHCQDAGGLRRRSRVHRAGGASRSPRPANR
ncbi:CbrC family protein [Streptomyces sp. 147326]|uniref:CbrC family protein n=1 Tax=Streptomyces sp. 147326 TaxID=3074379 RepID=UPI003857D75B